MKKLIVLMAVLLFSVACGGSKKSKSNSNNSAQVQSLNPSVIKSSSMTNGYYDYSFIIALFDTSSEIESLEFVGGDDDLRGHLNNKINSGHGIVSNTVQSGTFSSMNNYNTYLELAGNLDSQEKADHNERVEQDYRGQLYLYMEDLDISMMDEDLPELKVVFVNGVNFTIRF